MSNNPPGWYADPFGRAQVRWWSGSGWTDHVATNGQEFIDAPLAAPATASPTTAAPAVVAAPAPAAAVPAAPAVPATTGKRPLTATQKTAMEGAVALLVGALGGWLVRGGGDDSSGSGGGGGGGGGVAAGQLTTPILQGLASLNSYEWSLRAVTVGPTDVDREEQTATGQSDSQADMRYVRSTSTSTSADDPEPYTSTSESWRSSTMSCTFDGEEYQSEATNPFEADVGTVLSGVFDIVIPAGNATRVGEETVGGVATTHWTFTIEGLGTGAGATVEQNQGDLWVANDGGYLVKYTVTTAMRSAPEGTPDAEVYRLELTLELTSVNQPVAIQMPAACPTA